MSCVWMLQRGHSGDGCGLALTLCNYHNFYKAQWGERSLSERTAQVLFLVRPDKTYTVFC